MKHYFFALAMLGCSTGVAGVLDATHAQITFNSSPPGAVIEVDGHYFMTPKTIYYTIPVEPSEAVIAATWHSGTTTTDHVLLKGGTWTAYTFNRPNGAELGADLKFASKLPVQAIPDALPMTETIAPQPPQPPLQQVAAQSQGLSAGDMFAIGLKSYVDSKAAANQVHVQPIQMPVTCTSQNMGLGRVVTNCN